jgi:hypothetical protein
VRGESPSASWSSVRDALVTEYAREYDVIEDEVDSATLRLARELADEHRVN